MDGLGKEWAYEIGVRPYSCALQFNKGPSYLDDEGDNSTITGSEGITREAWMHVNSVAIVSIVSVRWVMVLIKRRTKHWRATSNQMNIMVIRARNLIGVDKPLLGVQGPVTHSSRYVFTAAKRAKRP